MHSCHNLAYYVFRVCALLLFVVYMISQFSLTYESHVYCHVLSFSLLLIVYHITESLGITKSRSYWHKRLEEG